MRVAVTGASGLLGRALISRLSARRISVVAGVHRSAIPATPGTEAVPLDLLDEGSISRWLDSAQSDCIVHAAAWTDVDGCERDHERAEALNVDATRNLVRRAQLISPHASIICLSTDYVFDGTSGPSDEDAVPSPINFYGRTKLSSEEVVLGGALQSTVIRSASFLGVGDPGRPTFAESMLYQLRDHGVLRVPIDQRSNVTPVNFLADAVIEILETGASGIRHVAGSEITSRYELGIAIAGEFGFPIEQVQGVRYAQLGRPAPRPLDGGLTSRFSLRTKCPPLAAALAKWKSDLIAAGRWHDT